MQLLNLPEPVLTYLEGLRERRWIALAVAFVVSVIGWIVVGALPNHFQADAKVYVDTESLLQPLLKGLAVQPNADQQVNLMYRTLITRPNLEQVIRKTDLDLALTDKTRWEAKIKELREQISIKPDAVRNLYTLSYSNADPKLARNVVQVLLSIFVESNLGDKRRDMSNAQTFLDQRIAEYEDKLRAAEQRLAEFKQANIERLPGGGDLSGSIANAHAAVAKARAELEAARIKRDNTTRQLAATPRLVEMDAAPQVVVNNRRSDSAYDALQARINDMEKSRDGMRLNFKATHPDVVKVERTIARLKAELAGMNPDDGSGETPRRLRTSAPNVIFEQLRLRLADDDGNVKLQQRHLEDMLAEEQRLEAKRKAAPDLEAEFANINRDYQILKKNYNELLERRESARLARAVDDRRETLQFRVIEPAFVPAVPTWPNRRLLSGAVLAFGVACGVGLALLLTTLDDRFKTMDQLQSYFRLPVLGGVTVVQLPGDLQLARRRAVFYAGASVVLVMVFAADMVVKPEVADMVPGLTRLIMDRLPAGWL